MASDPSEAQPATLAVLEAGGESVATPLTVREVFNFGYAARDQAGLREHLRETASLGLPTPETIPALYPIPPDRVTTAAWIVVSGAETYAEVEYALVCDAAGRWLFTVASDHTDAGVERGSVPRGKSITPNVLAPTAWALADVEGHLDALTLTCECPGASPARVQRDSLETLLAPSALIETLARRTGRAPGPGTVILSGTIGGELPVGAGEWVIGLEDPVLDRRIEHRYTVQALADELPEDAEDTPADPAGSVGSPPASEPRRPRYGPADAKRAPRYTGVRTFARCPHVRDLDGADVAVVGAPFDTGTSFRVGARFGPEAIRSGSTLLRPYNANLDVDVFERQSVIDFGDLDVTPGDAVRSLGQIEQGVSEILAAQTTPIVLGGDHTIALGELRAVAARYGPVAFVLLDAHVDTGDEYYGQRYFHGTPFRRAVEEGLIVPERSIMAGMRGPLYDASEYSFPRQAGIEVIPCEQLRELDPAEYGELVRDRIGDAPAFLSFDIDIVDPGLAPATGTPEVAGLLPFEALRFVRALAGRNFKGYDVVEVSPQLDGPAQPTALLAANVAWEFLALNLLVGRGRPLRVSASEASPRFLIAAAPIAPLVRDAFDHPIGDLIHAPGTPAAAGALLSLVGVPFDTTTMGRRGSKHAPAAMRSALAGLVAYHGGFDVDLGESGGLVDHGDVDVIDTDVEETWRRISAVTRRLASEDRPVAALGGDHGLTFPALRGLTQALNGTVALVSLDAHFDVRPGHRGQPASGVPFRYALEKLDGRVLPEASSQIGIAGWENSAEAAAYLRHRGVRTFSAREAHRRGVEAIVAEVLDRAAGADRLWLTLDIDAVDAAYAPGTNAPTIGGLTSDQFLESAWLLGGAPTLSGVDVVEVSPPLDVAGITSLLGAQTLLTVLAARHAVRAPTDVR